MKQGKQRTGSPISFGGYVLLAFFLATAPALAAGAPELYTLDGRVIPAGSDAPFPQVQVRVVETEFRAVTDPEGRFVLEFPEPGRYTLAISHPQFLDQTVSVRIPAGSDLEIRIQHRLRRHDLVTVTAAPWAVDRSDVAQATDVLDSATVRVQSGVSIGEAIRNLPGVRSVSTGESGLPMIRGQTNERIRVLSNGFPHDYYQFSRRHMPNIEPFDSGSIEVIRGPASVLYGTQAMGGLTNLVAAPLPTAFGRKALLGGELLLGYAGNNEAIVGHGQLEGARGGFGGRVSWTRRAAGDVGTPAGDLSNTDYDQQAGLLEAGYQFTGGTRIRGQYRYWENDLGFYLPEQPDFRLDLRNDIGEVEVAVPSRPGEWRFAANISGNTRRSFPLGRSEGVKVDLALDTRTYRASLRHKPSDRFRGWIQLEYNRQKNQSFGPVMLLPGYRTRTWAAALFEEIRLLHSGNLDRLILNVGFRYDHRRLDLEPDPARGIAEPIAKSYTPFTGSVGAVYRFSRALSAGLSFSRGWRNPSEYELFADGPHDGALLYEKGNPDLKEETNLNAEFTLRLEHKRVRGFMALFRNRFDNYIYQRLSGENVSGLPVGVFSQSEAVVNGIEGQLGVEATGWLRLSAGGDALRTKNLSSGKRLPFTPPDRAIMGAHLHRSFAGAWIHPFVEIRAVLTGRGRISGSEEPFPLDTAGYGLIDLGAGIQRRVGETVFSFDLWIRNLGNRSYRDFLDTCKTYALSPGRNFRATLRFLF